MHLVGAAHVLAGGADRLVRLLRVLHLALVRARGVGQVRVAVQVADLLARAVDRLVGQVRRVGADVRDVPALVQALGDAHGAPGREAQLPARFLLERRGGERRLRSLGERFRFDRCHLVLHIAQPVDQRLGVGLLEVDDGIAPAGVGGDLPGGGVEVAAAGHLAPVELDERGRESVGGLESALEVPVLGGPEGHAGALALDDEARGDALDPARRQPGHHLLPEDRRHLVADEAVEHPAALLRVDQLHVELAPVLDRFLDGRARDLVEDHAPHRDVRPEHLEHVPRDRLALAVLVGREIELAGVLERVLEVLDDVLLLLGDHVDRLEVVLDVDPQAAGVRALVLLRDFTRVAGQVADVPDARLHHVVRAEVARDGAGLRRRLDDHERLGLGHVRNPRVNGYERANRGKSASPCCHEPGARVKHSLRCSPRIVLPVGLVYRVNPCTWRH